jgi:hypothetical protein
MSPIRNERIYGMGGEMTPDQERSRGAFLGGLEAHGVKTGAGETYQSGSLTVKEKVTKNLDKMFKSMGQAKDAIQSMTDLFKKFEVFQPLFDIFGAWMEILQTALLPIIEALLPLFLKLTPLFQILADVIASLLETLLSGDAWKEAGQKIKDFFVSIGDWFKEAWNNLKNWFNKNIIDPLLEFFRRFLNGVVGMINVILRRVNKIIPGTRYDIGLLSVSV